MRFTNEEINLNREVTDLIEITEVNKGDIKLLNSNWLPIILGNKMLIALDKNKMSFDRKTYTTFRPCINGRHVQLLLDFMFLNEEGEVEEIVSIKQPDNTYKVVIKDGEGNEVLSTTGETDTLAKFRLFYNYYLGEDCKDKLDIILANEEKNRQRNEARKALQEELRATKSKRK